MIDIYNILIGIGLMLLGILIGIPNLKEKLNGKTDKSGAYMKIFVGAAGLFLVGLVMVLREVFLT